MGVTLSPASMVDRITPETDDHVRGLVAEQFGIRARCPAIIEPFMGVRFGYDVTPYKLMKTRLLNTSRSASGYLVGGSARARRPAAAARRTGHLRLPR